MAKRKKRLSLRKAMAGLGFDRDSLQPYKRHSAGMDALRTNCLLIALLGMKSEGIDSVNWEKKPPPKLSKRQRKKARELKLKQRQQKEQEKEERLRRNKADAEEIRVMREIHRENIDRMEEDDAHYNCTAMLYSDSEEEDTKASLTSERNSFSLLTWMTSFSDATCGSLLQSLLTMRKYYGDEGQKQ
jgi:hypothetical protein